MITNSALKLGVGIAIGVAVYFTYKKSNPKHDRLDKPFKIGSVIDEHFEMNKAVKRLQHKHGQPLKKTNQVM